MPLLDSPADYPQPVEASGSARSPLSVGIIALSSLLLALVAVANIAGSGSTGESWPLLVIVANAFWLVAYLLGSYRLYGSLYSFSGAFLLVLIVFSYSQIIVHGLGVESLPYLTDGPMSYWYERASWFVSLAIASFGLGQALLAGSVSGAQPIDDAIQAEWTRRIGRWVGWGLFCASLVALGLLVVSVGNVFAYSRTEIYGGIGDSRGLGFLLLVLPTSLILLVCTAQTRSQHLLSLVLAGFTALVILFLGERSAVLFPGLVGLIIWRKLGRKVPLRYLLAGIVLVLVVIPAVRELRTLGPYSEVSVEDVAESVREARVKDVFLELGSTHGILADVLIWVPESNSYRYGASYLRALEAAIPNVGFSARTSQRQSVQGAMGPTDPAASLSPADWYIYETNRWIFDRGGGSGFSAVAEAYLNFGGTGVVVVFLLTGMLFAKLDSVDLRLSPGWLIACSILCWPLLKIVRNDFETFVKPVGLMVVTLVIWWLLSRSIGAVPRREDRTPA